jgi:transposase
MNIFIYPYIIWILSTKQIAMTHKLSKGTNLALYRWGHYRFRSLLISKGAKRGCSVLVGTEEYTSMTCGRCFALKDIGREEVYNCENCGAQMGRDDNAARNILMLNWNKAQLSTGLPSTLRPLS